MGYVVVVLAIINSAALVWAALLLLALTQDLPGVVEAAIQQEVRKQDDRMEKRHQRAAGPAPDSEETQRDGVAGRVIPGQPFRKR